MKNKIIILKSQITSLLSFLPFIFLISELQAKDIVVVGYYINLKGDTIKTQFALPLYTAKQYDTTKNSKKNNDDLYADFVKIRKPNQKKIQWGIIMINESGEKIKLLPSHCKYFQFNFQNDTLKFVSSPNNYLTSKTFYPFSFYPDSLFLRLLINGPLSLYLYVDNKELPSSYSIAHPTMPVYYKTQRYCLKKNTDNYLQPYSKQFFKGELYNYLSDCPIVIQKIWSKIYLESDIHKIVNEYNLCKLNK